MDNIFEHEHELTCYAINKMSLVKGLTIYGSKKNLNRLGVISFNLESIHSHDLAQYLNSLGIAIRSGHHCAMPLHREKLMINSSARASFYIYNSKDEVDKFIEGLNSAYKFFRK
jgi:cysteine desulfurase / selenocysteine lyase